MRMLALIALALLAACGREAGPRTAFDPDAAMRYVKAQLDFGPRVPGTVGARRAGDWIVQQMRRRADTVVVQSWTHVTAKGDTLPLRNILARFRPAEANRVLYVTHWDTRPTADADPVLGNRSLPIPGANDGASGVGLFVALGDVLERTPPTLGVDLLFVDGEDWGSFDGYDPDSALTKPYDVLIGSTYFANHLPSPDYRPVFGVLWDMIGDADLQFYQEINSLQAAPEVVSRVWETASDLGYSKYFIPQPFSSPITDDHVPLLKRGLRVIDVIDLTYGPVGPDGMANPDYHHTMQDTFDKLSAHSLQVAGDVATTLVTR